MYLRLNDKEKNVGYVLLFLVIVFAVITGIETAKHPNQGAEPSHVAPSQSVGLFPSPSSSSNSSSTQTHSAPSTQRSKAVAEPTLIYVVRKGDNLTYIKKFYSEHFSLNLLYEWNSVKIKNPNLIYAGTHLIVRPGSRVEKIVN